jgi:arabinogalactan oligomer/maltooligosaccharide transport system substrate-binding protein
MNVRKLLTLVVACALGTALVLVSCTKKEPSTVSQPQAGSTTEPGEPGETEIAGSLLVWMDNEDWAKAVIAGFNRHYPNVTIKFENVGNVDARGKVSLDGPAGIGPDVFLLPHDHMGNAIIDGILEPFTPEQQRKYAAILLDASMKTCTIDGELYAVPISTENIALFYNKDLLGDTPVPTSFEELIAFAQKWNVPDEHKWALRWSVDDSYTNYFFLTAFGMRLFGPDMSDFRNPGWDSEAARKGVEFYQSLRQLVYNVNVADASYDATTAAFQRGEVPFTISGPWAIADATKNNINFGITKLPTINGVQPRCFSGNIVACVSSYTNNPDAAFAFVDYLASIEGETIQFETTGKLAAYKDISGIPGLRDDPLLKGIMEQAPYADPMPIIPEMAQAWDAQKALFTFTWDGQLSVSDAQKKAMETYDTALMMAGKSRQ